MQSADKRYQAQEANISKLFTLVSNASQEEKQAYLKLMQIHNEQQQKLY
jgi:hypothetical protein